MLLCLKIKAQRWDNTVCWLIAPVQSCAKPVQLCLCARTREEQSDAYKLCISIRCSSRAHVLLQAANGTLTGAAVSRVRAVAPLRGVGGVAYPHKFHTSMRIPDFVAQFEGLDAGVQLTEQRVSLAGGQSLKSNAAVAMPQQCHRTSNLAATCRAAWGAGLVAPQVPHQHAHPRLCGPV